MKARVKATGEILEVEEYHKYLETGWKYKDNAGMLYKPSALDFSDEAVIGYWTRLVHHYAGMAMQGMLSNTSLISMLFDATKDHDELLKEVIICSHEYAHALVEKMKEADR